MTRRYDETHDGPAMRACEAIGFSPKSHPLGDDHHTDRPLSQEDKAFGEAIAWFLGGLFVDVDERYFYYKMTSIDTWARINRALRIHGLKIVNAETQNALDPQGRQQKDEEGEKPEG